jgi:branched-chain amino acid transport system substrate-binding protein
MRIHVKNRIFGFLTVALLLFSGCDMLRPEPIRIGFVAGLTGRTAAVGTAARDGALFAVNEVNRAGGINGREVELIIRDIELDAVTGINAVEELVEVGVPAIIGPMTSTMAMVLTPALNGSDTVMVSPTAATSMLGGKDDNFFRLRPQCDVVARQLADHVYDERKLRRIAVIFDAGNSVYTTDWKNCFGKRLQEKGGEVVGEVAFDSQGQYRFTELVKQALAEKPEGLLLLASSLDTAMLTQQMMKQDIVLPVFATEWSVTRDLLTSGGRSVEGISVFHVFNESSQEKRYLDFKKRFQTRFRKEISFPVVHAYDATMIVLDGLKKGARSGPELKKYFLQQDSFETLQSSIRFDRYGDVERELFLTVVKNGRFVVIP